MLRGFDKSKPGAFARRSFRSAAVAATDETPTYKTPGKTVGSLWKVSSQWSVWPAEPRDAYEAFYALCGVGVLCRGPGGDLSNAALERFYARARLRRGVPAPRRTTASRLNPLLRRKPRADVLGALDALLAPTAATAAVFESADLRRAIGAFCAWPYAKPRTSWGFGDSPYGDPDKYVGAGGCYPACSSSDCCNCLTGDCAVVVETDAGARERRLLRDLVPGDRVETGAGSFRRLVALWATPCDGAVAVVDVAPGCRLTPGHPVLPAKGGWTRAAALGPAAPSRERFVYGVELEGHVASPARPKRPSSRTPPVGRHGPRRRGGRRRRGHRRVLRSRVRLERVHAQVGALRRGRVRRVRRLRAPGPRLRADPPRGPRGALRALRADAPAARCGEDDGRGGPRARRRSGAASREAPPGSRGRGRTARPRRGQRRPRLGGALRTRKVPPGPR